MADSRRRLGARAGLLIATLLLILAGCSRPSTHGGFPRPQRQPAVSERAMLEAEQQLTALSRESGPFALRLTEEALNAFVAHRVQSPPLSSASLWLTPSAILLETTVDVAGRHVVQAVAEPALAEGTLQVVVRGLWWDGHRVPYVVCASLQESLNAALADAHAPYRLTQITLGEGRVDVAGSID